MNFENLVSPGINMDTSNIISGQPISLWETFNNLSNFYMVVIIFMGLIALFITLVMIYNFFKLGGPLISLIFFYLINYYYSYIFLDSFLEIENYFIIYFFPMIIAMIFMYFLNLYFSLSKKIFITLLLLIFGKIQVDVIIF
ncbi:MAG: hypothetical protein ACRCYT_01490 [Cetobacterium sp.]